MAVYMPGEVLMISIACFLFVVMGEQGLGHQRLRYPELGRGMLAKTVVGFALLGVKPVRDLELLQLVDGRSYDGCFESNWTKSKTKLSVPTQQGMQYKCHDPLITG